MILRRTARLLIALAALFAAPSCGRWPDRAETFRTIGIAGEVNDTGTAIVFKLQKFDMQFEAFVDALPDRSAFEAALADSAKTGRGMMVRYQPTGDSDSTGTVPSYIVRSIEYKGVEIAGEGEWSVFRALTDLFVPGDEALAGLARGVALHASGRNDEALIALDDALKHNSLDAPLAMLARRIHGEATWGIAIYSVKPGPVRDKLLVSALQDYAAVMRDDRDSFDAAISSASLLGELGDDADALAAFDGIRRDFPDSDYTVRIDRAIALRLSGKYQAALAELDALVKDDGPQSGMRYHYHRGWLLIELGRYRDAIAELTAGLDSQPDYLWAFVLRACAHTKLGELRPALSDQDEAVKLGKRVDDLFKELPGFIQERDKREAVLKLLHRAVDGGPQNIGDEVCSGYWYDLNYTRAKSPLLTADMVSAVLPDGTPAPAAGSTAEKK
ncbi:MAG: tetratricopeptide repeat protein [Proteobacteria bacterium]|nr:tetratricopeptide repeat protein [Pseudomonadota bacterium]